MNNKLKFDIYILSLVLFFICAIILEFKLPEREGITFYTLLQSNYSCLVFIVLVAYCWFVYRKFRFLLNGRGELSTVFINVTPASSDQLDFLSTFIIPLITLNIGSLSSYIVLFILIVSIGIIYIKTEKYCQSPVLSLLGFNLYKVEFFRYGKLYSAMALSRSRLDVSTDVRWCKLSENVIFVR